MMKLTFYILYVFTLFVSIVIATTSEQLPTYTDKHQSVLYKLLTNKLDRNVEKAVKNSISYVFGTENIEAVRQVLKDADMTPFDMYDTFMNHLFHPVLANLANDRYAERRVSTRVQEQFDEFDSQVYYGPLQIGNIKKYAKWDKLTGLSSKEEVMCEAAFFYGVIDFERALTCLDAAPYTPLTAQLFSNFVADMYFGEALRPDFSYEGDAETRKWLDDTVAKYEGAYHPQTTSLMRRFTQNIRGQVDGKLWKDYMRAMMTVHLSATLIRIKESGLDLFYAHLIDSHIHDEYMFASLLRDPILPGHAEKETHAFLRTFKLDSNNETATIGVINSGDGIHFHDKASFELDKLPDTISKGRHATRAIRYIPFVVFEAVPEEVYDSVGFITDSMDKTYFKGKHLKQEFRDYKPWQYIDDQRAGTCTAMSLWSALYWFERESQQKLESFRLALYLEVLKEATKELAKFRKYLEELDVQKLELADDDPKWSELQSKIEVYSKEEDDYLRFFSVGFNSAIRSIRYLHNDLFEQGLDMTAVMQKYATFYESQEGEKYWQLVKPNIYSLYNSTHIRLLGPTSSPPSTPVTKISTQERDCVNEVNQAITAKDPFDFVKAVISGTDLKCQSKAFLASIHFGVDALDLQTHHQDLILRALAKEIRSLSGGRLSILKLVHRLINDYGFKLFPTYDIPSTESIDFTANIYQVVLFEDDAGMKQFAANCAAFDSPGKNVLAAAYDLIKSAKETLKDLEDFEFLEDTEEYDLHKNLVEDAATELQSIDPHLYARYLSGLIRNAEQTGFSSHLNSFKLSTEWNRDDLALLENAAQESGPFEIPISRYINHPYNLAAGRDLASKYSLELFGRSRDKEYVCAGGVSRAIEKNSPLDFVKAVVFGVDVNCTEELFPLSISLGLEALELQDHHQVLVSRALLWHKSTYEMLEFIDELVAKGDLKLFSTDNTPPTGTTYTATKFLRTAQELKGEVEARRLAADLNDEQSLASSILLTCHVQGGSELGARFVDHTFRELGEMNPHLYAYHLSRLISQKGLNPRDFTSTEFKPSTEWDDYDYVLIENAVMHDYFSRNYYKIFNFPKEYHIDTENVRDESEFRLMSANPSGETLKEYATMLFNKMKDSLS